MELKKLFISEDENFAGELIESRSIYGLHKVDTYSLDHYLAIVISNALLMLANELHGWPAADGYEDLDGFDKWKNDILYHAETFRLYAEFDDRSSAHHDSIDWPEEDLDDNAEILFDRINNPSPEYRAAMDKWIELDGKDYDLTRERMNETFDWLKKWWPALWD